MFHRCKNLDEAKKLYRALSMCLHPDKGGTTELMVLLTEYYEVIKSEFEIKQKQEDMKNRYSAKKEQKPSFKGKYKHTTTKQVSDAGYLEIILEMFKKYNFIKDFDPSFLFSVAGYFKEHGYCTGAQYNALVNLYERFRFYDIN